MLNGAFAQSWETVGARFIAPTADLSALIDINLTKSSSPSVGARVV